MATRQSCETSGAVPSANRERSVSAKRPSPLAGDADRSKARRASPEPIGSVLRDEEMFDAAAPESLGKGHQSKQASLSASRVRYKEPSGHCHPQVLQLHRGPIGLPAAELMSDTQCGPSRSSKSFWLNTGRLLIGCWMRPISSTPLRGEFSA